MNHIFRPLRAGVVLLCCIGPFLYQIEAQSLSEAFDLSSAGKHQEAEQIFTALLTDQKPSAEAVLAHAYNLSWMGRHSAAIAEFARAIRLGADRDHATAGMAYTYAWDRRYPAARAKFSQLLQRTPDYAEARKGIAYTYLWEGNFQAAVFHFDELLKEQPQSYELVLSMGLAHLGNKNYPGASESFQRALDIQPTSEEARTYLQSLRLASPLLEMDIWAGYTDLREQINRFGLRQMQMKVQLPDNWQALLQYDNSLSLDILQLVRLQRSAPMFAVGAVKSWNQRMISEGKYGIRLLDTRQVQHVAQIGHTHFLSEQLSLKTGGFVGFGAAIPAEWMAYLAVNFPLFPGARLEPTYYYLRPSDSPAAEHRYQLGLLLRNQQGYELNVYGTYGRGEVPIEDQLARQSMHAWGISGLLPVSRLLWLQLAARQEKGFFTDFTTLALGARLRFGAG